VEQNKEILKQSIDYAITHSSFNKALLVTQAENVCVFGLGKFFQDVFVSKNMKEKYKVNLLSDNDPEKWGKVFYGIECVPPERLKEYKNLVVIITIGNPVLVENQLNEMGIDFVSHGNLSLDEMTGLPKTTAWFKEESDKMLYVFDLLNDKMSQKVFANVIANRIGHPYAQCSYREIASKNQDYFDSEVMKLTSQESFVDCGAYTGDTIDAFLKEVSDYRAVYSFELDYNNYKVMEASYGNMEKIHLYNSAVWNEEKEISYSAGGGSNEPREGISVLKAGEGTTMVGKAVVLDKILAGKEVTYIKMDIEGAELPALQGCKKIITEQKPKLAICLYHKISDFWEIPLLIKFFRPDYQFAVRHYNPWGFMGTVLYAW